MTGLSHLNQAIVALAPPFGARDDAPGNWKELTVTRNFITRPVWAGGSSLTIFQDARVNHAFRAWHDATHLKLDADFTRAGEARTCEAQIIALYTRYPSAPAWIADLLRVEILGQFDYAAEHGSFPDDQLTFTKRFLDLPTLLA